jgi:hypothetical protein
MGVCLFLVVFVSCLPAAIPFAIFLEPHLALRVSTFLLIVLFFRCGENGRSSLEVIH